MEFIRTHQDQLFFQLLGYTLERAPKVVLMALRAMTAHI